MSLSMSYFNKNSSKIKKKKNISCTKLKKFVLEFSQSLVQNGTKSDGTKTYKH